jgi:predicted ATPase with chaperone activity
MEHPLDGPRPNEFRNFSVASGLKFVKHIIQMKADVFAGASLYLPKLPETMDEISLPPGMIEGLILKFLNARGASVAQDIADELCLPYFNIVEPVIEDLRAMRLLEVTQGDMQAISYLLNITDAGRERARHFTSQSAYVGPAPVPLASYYDAIKAQTIRNITVNHRKLQSAFNDLVFNESILHQIGPAVNSGQSIFLYGPPGNGKTSIAERIVQAFGGAVFIPYAIEVSGAVIRLFDEYNHELLTPDEDPRLMQAHDYRWRLIRRPIIVVGGELTLDSLDLIWNEESRFYEAPFQLKANCGAFMVDDFGRQRMDPKELLNRWIVPLEKKVDYLTLHTGVKIEVPFDQLIIFSTNLDPRDLVDEAFLRRIRYKIPINDPTEEQFRRIWAIMSNARNMPYTDEVVDYFVQKHMRPFGRPYRGCIPRDILELVSDSCRFRQSPLTITPELLDDAAQAYFVQLEQGVG